MLTRCGTPCNMYLTVVGSHLNWWDDETSKHWAGLMSSCGIRMTLARSVTRSSVTTVEGPRTLWGVARSCAPNTRPQTWRGRSNDEN